MMLKLEARQRRSKLRRRESGSKLPHSQRAFRAPQEGRRREL